MCRCNHEQEKEQAMKFLSDQHARLIEAGIKMWC